MVLALAVPSPGWAGPPEPLFTYSPAAPRTNEVVTFTSTATGVIEPQGWDLDGDGACDDASGPTAQRSWPLAGSYWVRLCVTDGARYWTDTASVVVSNRPPIAAFTYAPSAPMAGDQVVLTSISADPDGPITSQSWELDGDTAFDDGSGPTAEVSFPAAGLYPVSLRITDQDGAATVATANVTVRERPPEPISPFPLVSMLAVVGQQGTTIRELVVKAPVGARVRVRCRGRGCPFRSFVKKADVHARASRIIRIHRFRGHLLRPGTVIEIHVTKRGEVGKYTRFVIRKGRPPKRVDRCLAPGSKRPVRCPSA
jgi:PKD repeat protein